MPRLNRFFLPGSPLIGDTLQLDAERSNYACKVLRLTPGQRLDIFNGEGGLYRCELTQAHQRRAQLQVRESLPVSPPAALAPSLAIGLLKGQAMDRAIQQATELGAKHLWLLQAERSNLSLKGERLSQKLDHWRRITASACEQCGQLWLPELHGPVTVQDCLNNLSDSLAGAFFDLDGEPIPNNLPPVPQMIFVGPEGGWTDAERGLFQQHQVPAYQLGNTVLRAETMPAVALALIRNAQHWA